ncbi:MAG: hypothetical protein ABSA85_08365 [Terracidiphilus sp.]|jgi:hypothetical protein
MTVRKTSSAVTRRRFLQSAALFAAPAALPAQSLSGRFAKQDDGLRAEYERRVLALAGVRANDPAALHELMAEWPTLYPPWTKRLAAYDSDRFGPLLAVSDEGENAETIARAAYSSAKARALHSPSPMPLGIMIDGERMVSAGEGPIGPDEYAKIIAAAFERTLCSTNVGVRVNARLYRLQPEFTLADAAEAEAKWLARVFAAFTPFLKTVDGVPRPLTVRLVVQPSDAQATVARIVAKLEAGRGQGLLGPASLHRFSLLSIASGAIYAGPSVGEIKRVVAIAVQAGISEVAIDGDLTLAARERMSVASLLNIVDVSTLRDLFAAARDRKVRLVYRYRVDADSAARTIWTGLQAARSFGFTAGKYGLIPFTLEEQEQVVALVSRWTEGWTAVPAFYVDTPLVTGDDVYDELRCVEAANLWMEKVRAAGARLVLFDCPDRIAARHLIRDAQHTEGVLTLDQIAAIAQNAKNLGLKPMWSGGITARLAFALGAQRVFAIFSTGAASRQVPVHGSFASDPDLASEGAPTELGVRRVHAALQAGFLSSVLRERNPKIADEIGSHAQKLLTAIDAGSNIGPALAALDDSLVRGWTAHWSKA